MKQYILTAIAVGAAQSAFAGGVDRSGQSIGIIYEDGNYAEFSLGLVSGDVSGVTSGAVSGVSSGDAAPSYAQFSAGYKWSRGGPIDVGIIFDQPFAAVIDYPAGAYPLAGSNAELKSQAVTVLANYDVGGGFSLHAGARAQSIEMEVALSALSYVGTGDRSVGYGYLVGAAFEKPEIALRVALTYNSAVDHDIDTSETGPSNTVTRVTTPQSVNLEFQTGIAADTLLFGSARWVEWSKFDISPVVYVGAVGAPIVSFSDDKITYSLGVGRKFTEEWSGAITVGYEDASGGLASNLSPTDGRTSVGLGATYTAGDMKLTGGVSYIWIGDATTTVNSAPAIAGNFSDNTALAAGFKIGWQL